MWPFVSICGEKIQFCVDDSDFLISDRCLKILKSSPDHDDVREVLTVGIFVCIGFAILRQRFGDKGPNQCERSSTTTACRHPVDSSVLRECGKSENIQRKYNNLACLETLSSTSNSSNE